MVQLLDLYRIDNFIDTFALGHYARVVGAVDQRTNDAVAFKVMRPEHLTPSQEDMRWEYRAFGSEAQLLLHLAESPHIVDLIDCGFISDDGEAPSDGEIESLGKDVGTFNRHLEEFAGRGWRPYITMPLLPRTSNLFYLMKPGQQSQRWRLPTEEGLALAWQFAHALNLAHQKRIVYMDHKLEHLYWDGTKLMVIDLNSSRQLEGENSEEQYYRMDIHNLCVGILYSVFTGLSPRKTTLRPQPSNRNEVEARYQDILTLDFGVEPTLSTALQELLQRGASMQIDTVEQFISELKEVAAFNGWDSRDHYTSPASREARDHLRAGLRKLREGQENVREARDLFREAAILDGITEDLEEELRRLVKVANDMLNNRVIP